MGESNPVESSSEAESPVYPNRLRHSLPDTFRQTMGTLTASAFASANSENFVNLVRVDSRKSIRQLTYG